MADEQITYNAADIMRVERQLMEQAQNSDHRTGADLSRGEEQRMQLTNEEALRHEHLKDGKAVLQELRGMTDEELARTPAALAALTKIGELAEKDDRLASLEDRGPGSKSHNFNIGGGLNDTQQLGLQILRDKTGALLESSTISESAQREVIEQIGRKNPGGQLPTSKMNGTDGKPFDGGLSDQLLTEEQQAQNTPPSSKMNGENGKPFDDGLSDRLLKEEMTFKNFEFSSMTANEKNNAVLKAEEVMLAADDRRVDLSKTEAGQIAMAIDKNHKINTDSLGAAIEALKLGINPSDSIWEKDVTIGGNNSKEPTVKEILDAKAVAGVDVKHLPTQEGEKMLTDDVRLKVAEAALILKQMNPREVDGSVLMTPKAVVAAVSEHVSTQTK